ncbi:MAG: 50S ribosomal protein L18 [marine benthic group bacterium]|jgi:large subunit ribosomal protein L18|nr:50S ribosomal protein L18 [Gemmatimonadota bacterium]
MAGTKSADRRARRARRHIRVRKKMSGTSERPRLVVFRSLRNMEGQLVDDDRGVTLLGLSTQSAPADGEAAEGMTAKVAAAYKAGFALAERAKEAGIERVVFDRAGFRYHGRVKAFADGARAGGLEF